MKQVDVRRHVYHLLGQMTKVEIVKHFQMKGIAGSTIYFIIKRCENGLPFEENARTARLSKLNKESQGKLKKMVKNQIGIHQRQLTKEFSVSCGCIKRNMKKMELNYYKRQRAPKYNQQQLEKIPGQCRKFINKKKPIIILDDEKYFAISGDNMLTNAGFYFSNQTNTPNDVKFKQKQKFKSKVLV